MTGDPRPYNLATIHSLLVTAFTVDDLRRFLRHRPTLRPILNDVSPDHGCKQIADRVITYCEARSLLGQLLDEVRTYSPDQYAHFEADLYLPFESGPTAPVISTPFNLPADLPDFAGRHAEIAELRRCLETGGTAIITGMGGVGKTALALRVAHALAAEGRFLDAQLYIDLRGSRSRPLAPAAALNTLLVALLGPNAQRPAEIEVLKSLWRQVLHGKAALLVLDNAADAAQVQPLLPGASACAVIVTSRQRFRLPRAELLDLERLQERDARNLLQTLASRLDDAEASEIAELCSGLPLALRAAGNYLALNDDCTPGEYAARLSDERMRLTRLRDPGDPGLNVAATIGLSVRQLDRETLRAWAMLALLPAPFDVSVAAALWVKARMVSVDELPPEVAGLALPGTEVLLTEPPDEEGARSRLRLLRNLSLVSYDARAGRYTQHDLLRLAAARELEAYGEQEIALARDRLATHYLYLIEDVSASQRYAALDPDWPLLRSVLVHAATWDLDLLSELVMLLSDYWAARGMADEQATWNWQAARAYLESGQDRDAAHHLGNVGLACTAMGEAREAISIYEQALVLFREQHDRESEGLVLGNMASAYLVAGELDQALQYYQQALTISREVGNREAQKGHLGNLGNVYLSLDDLDQAGDRYRQVLQLAREDGDRQGEGNSLANLGLVSQQQGNSQAAIDYLRQGLTIAREIGDRMLEANAWGGLGAACLALEEYDRALDYYGRALAIHRETGNPLGEANDLLNLGALYAQRGNEEYARQYWIQALAGFEAFGHPTAEKIRAALVELDDAGERAEE